MGAVCLIARLGCSEREAAGIATLLGALFYLPKFFRAPHFFLYHDELAHWYSTEQLLSGHGAFAINPDNPVNQYFPGLHVLTAALSSMTGLSVFAAGNMICAWAHIVTCLAVYGMCRKLTGSAGASVIAVTLFAANPAFFYFDAQFSYETMGTAFFVAILLRVMHMVTPNARVPWSECGLLGLLILALVVTHHATSYVMAATLAVLGIISIIFRRRAKISSRCCRQVALLAVWAIAASVTWLFVVAPSTLGYLRGPLLADFDALSRYVGGSGQSSRQLFSAVVIPAYEIIGSYAAVMILFSLYAFLAVTTLRRNNLRTDPRRLILLVLASIYFASLPVVYVFNDQTAKRPWVFAFVGLSVVGASVLYELLAVRRVPIAVLGFLLLCVLYVGGIVTLSGQDIRFPGPYQEGSDALSTTPDLVDAAFWMYHNYGAGNRFVGDEVAANVVGSYGRQDPLTYQNFGYEPWNIFFPRVLDPTVYEELQRDNVRFIVVDRRMLSGKLQPGTYYFDSAESSLWRNQPAITRPSLNKFAKGPFTEVYDNGNIVIWQYQGWRPTPRK